MEAVIRLSWSLLRKWRHRRPRIAGPIMEVVDAQVDAVAALRGRVRAALSDAR
jgi:hypothetical protein